MTGLTNPYILNRILNGEMFGRCHHRLYTQHLYYWQTYLYYLSLSTRTGKLPRVIGGVGFYSFPWCAMCGRKRFVYLLCKHHTYIIRGAVSGLTIASQRWIYAMRIPLSIYFRVILVKLSVFVRNSWTLVAARTRARRSHHMTKVSVNMRNKSSCGKSLITYGKLVYLL